ncbi:MAG: HD domain-containing phosphohydrolase [Nitrospirota bacterium]
MTMTASKPTILIVEDEAGPRDALKIILRPFYGLHMADNALTAMKTLREQPIDLVTLDLKLPDRQGMDLLRDIKQERSDVEVIIITGYGSLKSAMDGLRYGAAGYLVKPFNVTELISVINQALGKKQRLQGLREFLKTHAVVWREHPDTTGTWRLLLELYGSLTKTTKPALGSAEYLAFIPLITDLFEAKDRELLNHSSRASFYAGLLARRLYLPAQEQKLLAIGAFLHDIGTIPFNEPFLSKTGELEDDEREPLRPHPEIGARIILPLGLPAQVRQAIVHHHERYDGLGYPSGLQGERIPLSARIVGLVQAFDLMVTGSPAQPALSIEEASEQIQRQAGTRFDPKLAELFLGAMAENKTTLPALSSRTIALPD